MSKDGVQRTFTFVASPFIRIDLYVIIRRTPVPNVIIR